MANKKPDLYAYTIIETAGEETKDFWQRVGSAWRNQDGSINVSLNALPVNGRLHIREPKADDES
ncbi:MAG: hypothetical protein AAF465_13495 [Pseudomonadota bacterium]